MLYDVLKVLISAVVLVVISEVSKRSTLVGAILASVPFVSVLAIIWLYLDTHNTQTIASLSQSIFYLVLPSLVFFIALPILLKQQMNFYLALLSSLGIMIACYFAMISFLKLLGIKI